MNEENLYRLLKNYGSYESRHLNTNFRNCTNMLTYLKAGVFDKKILIISSENSWIALCIGKTKIKIFKENLGIHDIIFVR